MSTLYFTFLEPFLLHKSSFPSQSFPTRCTQPLHPLWQHYPPSVPLFTILYRSAPPTSPYRAYIKPSLLPIHPTVTILSLFFLCTLLTSPIVPSLTHLPYLLSLPHLTTLPHSLFVSCHPAASLLAFPPPLGISLFSVTLCPSPFAPCRPVQALSGTVTEEWPRGHPSRLTAG